MGKHKLMDQMDIDCVLVVPDTPTRLPAKNAENSSGVNKEIDTSLPSLSGQGNFSTEQHKTQLNNATGIRRLFIHHPRRHGSGNSECHANSSSSFTHYPSSSSRNDNLFARKDTSFSNCEEKDSGCVQFIKKDSTDSNPGLSSCKDSLHLMERSMPAQVLSGSSQGEGFSKRKVSSNGFSNLQSMKSSSETSNVDKEKQFDDGYKVGLNMLNGVRKEFVHDTQHNDKKDVSASLITLPRVTRQKRLVRNGCISPHNIAKAKKPVGRDHNDPLTVKQNYSSPVSSSSNSKSQINVKDLVSEGHASNTMKGKGIMVHPFTLTGLNEKNGHTSFRNVIAIDEEVTEITGANQDAFRSFEESGGWRSTRNHYQKSLSDEDHHLSLGNDINACSETKHNQHKLLRRENGTNAQSHDHYPNCEDLSSHRFPSARTSSQVARPLGQQLSHIDVHQPVINPLGKRQKQGSTSINNAECSTSAFNDTDIIFSDSFKDPNNNSRENTNQNCSRRDNLESTIEIDDLSPQATNDGSGGVACCRSDEDARARQVEADEVLALELQEQLFNEMPVFGVDEIDEHVARALHQEDFHHAFSGDTRHRGRSFANERRHSQFQSSINVSRRAPQASSSNRLARWRSRFPGQPRTLLSSTGRNSIFPSYMDVETRMEVLETLEAFSNMGVYGDFLQTQRDFNENDYEMLLALDENNHQHAGAPMHQINGLPESTVQNENLEEACAICLENPTIGETIRHLPCLHKFHKDCIDPWLQRRSSCPVCKSSIT